MKTNGIVRKVDSLGRIVIPREYRKLHKISVGDPMEISCMDSGEIVLSKLDTTLTLSEIVRPALPYLGEATGCTVLAAGGGEWIAGCGERKGEFVGKALPAPIAARIADRREFVSESEGLFVCPIAGDADVFGALCACGSPGCPAAIRAAAAAIGCALQKF